MKRAEVRVKHRVQMFGWYVTIKVGCRVTNDTALGPDDNYRFISVDRDNLERFLEVEGFEPFNLGTVNHTFPSTLRHDLTFHGYHVPKDMCTELK